MEAERFMLFKSPSTSDTCRVSPGLRTGVVANLTARVAPRVSFSKNNAVSRSARATSGAAQSQEEAAL